MNPLSRMYTILMLAAALLGVVLIGSLGYALKLEHAKTQALTVEVSNTKEALASERTIHKADTAALTKRALLAEQSRIHKELSNAAASKALAANPAWAGQIVPDGVIDAIGM